MREIKFENIAQLCSFFNLPKPEHPLFYVTTKRESQNNTNNCYNGDTVSYSNNFYTISLKKIVSGEILYGRTKYDSDTGVMLFTAPNQILTVKNVAISSEFWFIAFHKDFIRNYAIENRIRHYNFFEYSVNEALHLSPKESEIVKQIIENIEIEYYNNQDLFSKEIIVSLLDTLLKYSNRFYNRQFINREELNKTILLKMVDILNDYYNNGLQKSNGLPSVKWIASKLNMSHRYFSDTIKAQTGKNAKEQINLYIIDRAKSLLLSPENSISQIAYFLGFEYPQYFSRLFKQKTGITPKEYIKSTK